MKKSFLILVLSFLILTINAQKNEKKEFEPKTQTDTLYLMHYNWIKMEKERQKSFGCLVIGAGLGAYSVYLGGDPINARYDISNGNSLAPVFAIGAAVSTIVGVVMYIDSFKWSNKNIKLMPTGLRIYF